MFAFLKLAARKVDKGKVAKMAGMCAALSAVVATTALPTFAANEALTSAFNTGLSSVVNDSIDLIGVIVPIALTLFAVTFLVSHALRWFKSLAK